jgi:hypothetical protein
MGGFKLAQHGDFTLAATPNKVKNKKIYFINPFGLILPFLLLFYQLSSRTGLFSLKICLQILDPHLSNV